MFQRPEGLPAGTYCSDPEATHTVSGLSDKFGNGIFGYYTNEFTAHRAAKWYRNNGVTVVEVEEYDPTAQVVPGMNKFVKLSMDGYG